MATIKDYGNGKYRVIACNGRRKDGSLNRKSWTIEAKSMKVAKKKADDLEYEFKHGKKQTDTNKKFNFNDLINEWRETDKYRKLSPKTVERYEGMLEYKIIPEFGKWPLNDIRPLDVSHFIDSLGKPGARIDKNNQEPYSDKTIQSYYSLINTLLERGVKWELIEENVCKKADKPSLMIHKAKFYDREQVDKLLECLDREGEALEISLIKRNPNHRGKTEQEKKELKEERKYLYQMHKAYVYLALASSSRRSEVCALDWKDINFDTTYMVMDKTLQYSKRAGGVFIKPYLKNGEPCKAMYLPEKVIQILKEYKEEQESYKEIMGDKWVHTGKIFTALDGNFIHPNNISLWFKRFLNKYGLPYITLHEVRHTSISFMLMSGTPIEVVAERAGHRDSSVTTRIYGHVFENNKKKAAKVMEEMFQKAN